jgi:hypothetical protein
MLGQAIGSLERAAGERSTGVELMRAGEGCGGWEIDECFFEDEEGAFGAGDTGGDAAEREDEDEERDHFYDNGCLKGSGGTRSYGCCENL